MGLARINGAPKQADLIKLIDNGAVAAAIYLSRAVRSKSNDVQVNGKIETHIKLILAHMEGSTADEFAAWYTPQFDTCNEKRAYQDRIARLAVQHAVRLKDRK